MDTRIAENDAWKMSPERVRNGASMLRTSPSRSSAAIASPRSLMSTQVLSSRPLRPIASSGP